MSSSEAAPYIGPGSPIFEAGLRAFAAAGYHGASTRRIASDAGMSPAAMYIHYPTKAELLAALVNEGVSRLVADLHRVNDEAQGGPPEVLAALACEFVSWHARNNLLGRVVQHEAHHLPADQARTYQRHRSDAQALFATQVAAGRDSGEFHVEDMLITTIAIMSLGIDVARWYPERPTLEPHALGEYYADLALRMVGYRRPAGRR